jgi:hypothetical protein
MVIRKFLVTARPWQQALICISLVAVGTALVAVGVVLGAIMIVFGLLFGWHTINAHRSVRGFCAEPDVERSKLQLSFPRSSGQLLLVADHAACAAS